VLKRLRRKPDAKPVILRSRASRSASPSRSTETASYSRLYTVVRLFDRFGSNPLSLFAAAFLAINVVRARSYLAAVYINIGARPVADRHFLGVTQSGPESQ
jgi:hypothetical protein